MVARHLTVAMRPPLLGLATAALLGTLVASTKYDNTAKCCADDKLNVHIVCHTHDDVGWLKTVDQYYLGANNSIQHAGVQYILDSVMTALENDPSKRFTYVEQAFFTRWWNEQTPDKQDRVKKLVADEQLVFTNGGWCMHDEAAAHYVGMIDQTTVGHRFISETFGEKALPRVGWQIDPFGHSSTQAALLSGEVGFDALYFGRIDYQDMDVRKANRQLEFLWDASPSLGSSAGVFTGIFPSGNYGPPPGFCFDQFCSDDPVNDDPGLFNHNVQDMVNLFVERVEGLKAYYDGNNIMLQMGSDFQYENANEWYKNLDKLIHYVNKDGRLHAFYSTPITYTEARHAEGLAWTTKKDDFFPYADGEHMYWTGYFTSRASFKRLERVTSGYLQAARQVESLSLLLSGSSGSSSLSRLEEAQAVVQHHDAVAGTAKQHVSYDYTQRLAIGLTDAEHVMSSSVANLLGLPEAKFAQCRLLNETVCEFTQQATTVDGQADGFEVLVYNPLAHERSSPVRLPITTSGYAVYHGDELVASDVLESEAGINAEAAPYTLVFLATQIPPLGIKTYLVKSTAGQHHHGDRVKRAVKPRREQEDVTIANQHLSLTFSSDSGRLTGVTRKDSGVQVPVLQDFYYYKGHDGKDTSGNPTGQPAGAYIFRPTEDQARLPVSTAAAALEMVKGSVVTEVRQTFSKWVKQTVRLYDDCKHAELEWTVGPIPIEDGLGKEVVSLLSTGLQTGRTLYTDSNAREFLERNFNTRPTWNLTVHEPVAGNYYPINAAAFIRDKTAQVSMLVDRSQGVGSLRDGEMEVMVHRRLLHDDFRGVGEPLNETSVGITHGDAVRLGDGIIVRGKHLLVLSDLDNAISEVRSLMDSAFLPVSLLFSTDEAVLSASLPNELSFAKELPPQIALLSLRKLPNNKALVRLSHQYAVGEDPVLSQPVSVDLSTLFPGLDIQDITELTLTASQPKSHLKRLEWQSTEGEVIGQARQHEGELEDASTVVLGPMEIRTFEVGFKYDLPPPPMDGAASTSAAAAVSLY